MRHDPIEFAMVSSMARKRGARQTRSLGGVERKSEPCAIDEAFARFERVDSSASQSAPSHTRMIKHQLVHDLAAQLEALDRQRERLAQLLQSIETNSIAG